MHKLSYDFYNRGSVTQVAKELLGKMLVTNIGGITTSGRIVETEAYNGAADRASHAWNNRRTRRTEVMYGEAGRAYVYLCYGIHHLFNVVTNQVGIAHAVLIRAIEPAEGIPHMLHRRNSTRAGKNLGSGPGNVAKSLGLDTSYTGYSLLEETIYIADDGFRLKQSQIVAGPRIGVDYAGEDALLPYRFFIKDHPYVSGKKPA